MATASPKIQPTYNPLSEGSIWRRWDLHVHSPLTKLNNQYPQLPNNAGPDWEKFLAALESQTDLAVVGITDYFSIDGYNEIRKFREQGKLKPRSKILRFLWCKFRNYFEKIFSKADFCLCCRVANGEKLTGNKPTSQRKIFCRVPTFSTRHPQTPSHGHLEEKALPSKNSS